MYQTASQFTAATMEHIKFSLSLYGYSFHFFHLKFFLFHTIFSFSLIETTTLFNFIFSIFYLKKNGMWTYNTMVLLRSTPPDSPVRKTPIAADSPLLNKVNFSSILLVIISSTITHISWYKRHFYQKSNRITW